MREILFRGKRLDNGEWVDGSLYFDPDLERAQIVGFDYSISETGIDREEFSEPVDPATVGQYTGLLDKNWKRIFEGDILCSRFYDLFHDETTIEVVKWFRNGWFTQQGKRIPDEIVKDGVLTCSEVIGNVHDNPELLEGD